MTERKVLSTLLGTYPKTQALKSGKISVAGAALEMAPIDDAMKGFKGAVRDLKYDVAELALSTFLQAKSVGKPYVLLPFVMNGKFHHASLLKRSDDSLTADQLHGRRVAMRAYSQTTPTWVRGFLMDDFGIEVEKVDWLVQGDGHVAECTDPSWVRRMSGDKDLFTALQDGEVDAILFGGKRGEDSRFVTVLSDPGTAAMNWSERNNAVPINHMVAIREEIAEQRPDLVRAVYRALIQSRDAAEGTDIRTARDPQPYGFERVRPALEIGVRYAVAQGLISESIALDRLYGPVSNALSGVA